MSFIHGDGATHLSDYENEPKSEKEVMRLVELLGEKLSDAWDICKELRYYALYINWDTNKYLKDKPEALKSKQRFQDDKGFEHCGLLAEFHWVIESIIKGYFRKRDILYSYITDFKKKYCFKKLKPDVIEHIKENIDTKLDYLRERGY